MSTNDRIRVLFLCTHNQARSQMAEALLRFYGGDRFEVYSAGSDPAEAIHPMAVETLRQSGIALDNHKPKHFDTFRDQAFDYIITTCDRIAGACPTFPGDPKQIHWSFEDPADAVGNDEERQRAFNQIAILLQRRIRIFVNLPAPKRRSLA